MGGERGDGGLGGHGGKLGESWVGGTAGCAWKYRSSWLRVCVEWVGKESEVILELQGQMGSLQELG